VKQESFSVFETQFEQQITGEKTMKLTSGLSIINDNFSTVLSHATPARVIVAVPHDGLPKSTFSGWFQERSRGTILHDINVWPIAKTIVQNGLELGVSIDAVRFLMARAYVDANRALQSSDNLDPDTVGYTALTDKNLVQVYEHYHEESGRLISRAIAAHGVQNVLFVDLHGFARHPEFGPPEGYDLILGTANRTTIPYKNVDQAFAAFLEQCGYTVFLPSEKPRPEGDPYSAGQTTRRYAKQYGVNAMQVEIARKFRGRDDRAKGEKLARDIAKFFAENYH